MSYETGIFIGKNPARASQRDDQFAKFFADLGLTPEPDPFAHEPDPSAQVDLLKSLIVKAKELHEGETSAIDAMERLIATQRLGVPTHPVTRLNRPNIESCMPAVLGLSFFDLDFG